MMHPRYRTGLCWGTAPQASLVELARLAAAHGFQAISITPGQFRDARAAGHSGASLLALIDDLGLEVSVIDPLMSALPGMPAPHEIEPRFRHLRAFTEEDCFTTAEALRAPTVNQAHFLGRPGPMAQMVDAVGGIAGRARQRGLSLSLEFIPGTGIPDLPTALAIVAQVGAGNLGVMLDVWHLARSGGLTIELATLPPGVITAFQLNDRREPPPGETYVPLAGRLPPGEGELPLVSILNAVLAANPALNIGLEVFTAEAGPADEFVAHVAQATRALLAELD